MATISTAANEVDVLDEAHPNYIRSRATIFRFVLALAVTALVYVPVKATAGSAFAERFSELLHRAPHWVITGIVGVAQIGALIPPVLGVLTLLALRRFVRLGRMLLGGVLAVGLLILVARLVGGSTVGVLPQPPGGMAGPPTGGGPLGGPGGSEYGIGAAFPTGMDIALIFAFYFVDSPQWHSKWRTIGRVVLFFAVLARLGAGMVNPWTIALVVSVSFVAAQLVFLAFGIVNSRPHASDVARMLERFGFPLASIRRVPHFTDFTGYLAEAKSGQMLFAKIVSREDWTAFLPVRLYRAVRFRDVGEARPFTKLRHRAEHEALASLKALGDGVSTPQLLFVSEYQANSMALVFETPKVQQAATVLDEQPSRELLASLWRIVEKLRAGHTVHRRLNSDTVILDESGEPLVIDFSSAELGVTGPALSIDVAELLAASAARVGVEAAVEVAADTIGTEPLGEAISRLQPLALTKPTRHAVQQAKCLDDLRAQVQLVSGVESVPLVQLERVKPQSIMMVVMSGVALWSLIPQFAGFGSVWGKFASANWWWIIGALGLSALTYVAAAVALSGSTTERLPLAPNVGVQLATSFVGVAAPGGAFVLAGRFLQRRGLDAARASAAIAVDTVAGVVVHLILTGLFIALAGTSGLKTFSLPSLSTIGIYAAGLVVAVLLAFVIPKIRELAREHLLPAVQRAAGGVRGVAQRPSKMVELFGGSVGITLGYVFALEMSVLALGGGPSFTSVALVYLVGSVVSSVAPTPGGIGAVEATLIAGLTSAGMTSATAIAAVLLFRLATFWLPLLPGWGALAVLQRSGDL